MIVWFGKEGLNEPQWGGGFNSYCYIAGVFPATARLFIG